MGLDLRDGLLPRRNLGFKDFRVEFDSLWIPEARIHAGF